jgi:DNA-binding Xre family transcriptional regulator
VRGVALKELAARAGVAYQTLQAVETKSDARLSTLQRLASALEVEVADLMDTARFNAALARAAEANLPD